MKSVRSSFLKSGMAEIFFSRSSKTTDKHVEQNALAVQKLIVGPCSISHANSKAPPVTKAQLTRIKSELMGPKSANRLISKLRELPVTEEQTQDPCRTGNATDGGATAKHSVVKKSRGPIHAVCLQGTDEE